MQVTYVSKAGSGPTYEIESDRHGSYTIRCDGRVLKRVTSVSSYPGKPRWGSRKMEETAVEEAKALIDAYHGSH
jgi:hypothetical protein